MAVVVFGAGAGGVAPVACRMSALQRALKILLTLAVLTHSQCLQECGDWDQQANWTNPGIPPWVTDKRYDQAACNVKGEEAVGKGQAKPAQAPAAKRKSASQEPAPKTKRTAAKPPAAKALKGGDSDGSDEEEEDDEQEEEEETPAAQRPKQAAERSETEEVAGQDRGTMRPP